MLRFKAVSSKKQKGQKEKTSRLNGKRHPAKGKGTSQGASLGVSKRLKLANEEISSSSESEVGEEESKAIQPSSEEEEEITEEERRLKLAKKYLGQIEKEHDNEDAISQHLKRDVLDKTGQLQKKLADDCHFKDVTHIKSLKGHKQTVTCLVISNDENYAFSASKDGTLIKWCLKTFRHVNKISGGPKMTPTIVGHSAHVTALALSTDFKFLASGDKAKNIRIWNPKDLSVIHNFSKHRDGITGLAFRVSSHQLFSVSADRSVKIWNLDEMGYVETLFGHQDSITSVDSLIRDRALTSGGRDCTLRLWKIPEEAQLVFQGNRGSIDCVNFINEQHFVSGDDQGNVSLWGIQKKKPLSVVADAHGKTNGVSNWITALTALPNSDLIASGSQDGFVRVWKCKEDFKGLVQLAEIPVVGFVNGLKFSKSGSFLLVAVGQEHRSGRWWRIKEAKNCLYYISLKA